MVATLRHRQSKEAATDMFSLQPPRHISTLPITTVLPRSLSLSGQSGLWEVVRPSASMSSRPSLVAVVMKHARRHYYLLWGWR